MTNLATILIEYRWNQERRIIKLNEIQFLMYEDSEKVEVVVQDETIWATQKTISKLFDVGIPAISKHLKNIFDSGELIEDRTISKMEIVQNEGGRSVKRATTFYNLDVIISIGYRVNSQKATKFRIWATDVLKDYIRKGFKIDVERMKQGEHAFSKDYFRELLETVRSIRASERRIWQQITDVFAEISYDYDKNAEVTKQFYATVQNKFHYAITGRTAAEIVYGRADKTKENMGLTTWKHSPDGRILQSDVAIAKNYLTEKQIRSLERNVSSYFDYVERLLEDEILLSMEDFAKSIDEFLTFNRYQILEGNGQISSSTAKKKAINEYKEFNKHQKIVSDFDKEMMKIRGEME